MDHDHRYKPGGKTLSDGLAQDSAQTPGLRGSSTSGPGKSTLTMSLPPVQMVASAPRAVQMQGNQAQAGNVPEIANTGISGAGGPLPHLPQIQRAFGRHDVGGIQAHVGGPAAAASDAIGANAYATGSHVAFRDAPDLHTAAHEAAHVVQQRGGVQLKGGVGEAGDQYEQHADAVADRVVRGESAEAMLDRMAGSGAGASSTGSKAVQRDIKGKGTVPMGEFAIDMTKQENVSGKSGESGTVTFTANNKSPDVKSIRLTQVVKTFDLGQSPAADYNWTGGESDRNLVQTTDSLEAYTSKAGDTLQSISQAKTQGHVTPDEIYQANKGVLKSAGAADAIPEKTALKIPKVKGGFFVDHAASDPQAAPRTNAKDAQVSRFYRDYWPNASSSQDGSKQGKTIQPASLWDYPGGGSSFKVQFTFETVARAEEAGLDYGTVHWGFTIDGGKVLDESHRILQGTSETFRATQQKFDEFYKNSYTVMQGDTLRSIALRFLGSEDKWPDIYNANKGVISDPDLIFAGMKLDIPGVSA